MVIGSGGPATDHAGVWEALAGPQGERGSQVTRPWAGGEEAMETGREDRGGQVQSPPGRAPAWGTGRRAALVALPFVRERA